MKHQTLKNLVLSFVALTIVLPPLSAQTDRVDSPTRSYAPAKVLKAPQRIIYTDGDLPDEYSRLGTTSLWVRNDSAVFDILGKFNSSYYSSTYDGGGYITAIRVDDEDDGIWASDIKSWYTDRMEDCIRMGDNENYQWYRNEFLTGRAHGLDVKVTLEPLGEYAHVVYNVTNTDETPHTFSLGSRADLSLGDYDLAPITLVRDKNGNPFGLEMASSLNPEEAATLQFLFKNRSGVSDVDGYWFGQYGQNSSSRAVAGDYT